MNNSDGFVEDLEVTAEEDQQQGNELLFVGDESDLSDELSILSDPVRFTFTKMKSDCPDTLLDGDTLLITGWYDVTIKNYSVGACKVRVRRTTWCKDKKKEFGGISTLVLNPNTSKYFKRKYTYSVKYENDEGEKYLQTNFECIRLGSLQGTRKYSKIFHVR